MHKEADLNDLLYVAAVAEGGSLSAAARALDVNHATVFRRIAQLEKRLGVRLFERIDGRHVPTAAGEELAAAGSAMQALALGARLKVAGRDVRPGGVVRLTTTDSVARALLNPLLLECRQRYPEITVHLRIDNSMFNLARREADIAVRPALAPPDYLIGKRIAALAFGVYGAASYLDGRVAGALEEHDWIGLGEAQERHRSVRWLAETLPQARLVCRIDGFAGVAQACAEGLGLAVLPCFLGDGTPGLRRVGVPDPALASELWLLTHPELRATARVKAVFDLLQLGLRALAPRLEGRAAALP